MPSVDTEHDKYMYFSLPVSTGHWKYTGVDGRITLERNLRQRGCNCVMWVRLSVL
jgi:hypothetical protein